MRLGDLRVRLTGLARDINALPGASAVMRPLLPGRRGLRDCVKDADVLRVSEKLFNDGHHARAVEEAFKYFNNLVKSKAGLPGMDGSNLMKTALSANSPVLKLNAGISTSERDEQLGYMEISAGSMTGIRNPRAHEHEWEDSEEHALQLLVLADHLVGRVKASTKVPPQP